MYVAAMGQLARARWDHNETVERVHPGPRSPEPMPGLVAKPPRPRNVVMLITESVRAQSVCLDYTEDCKYTPFSNKAELPKVVGVTNLAMRPDVPLCAFAARAQSETNATAKATPAREWPIRLPACTAIFAIVLPLGGLTRAVTASLMRCGASHV